MAVDMFLKIRDIPGESTDSKHKDEIEIFSFSWGVSNPGSLATGGGTGTGKASFQDFHFSTRVNKSSPVLFLSCASGKHIEDALLTLRKAGDDRGHEFLKLTLSDLIVSSYQPTGEGGSDSQLETFSLNYSKIEIEYAEQKADGSTGQTYKAGWDLKSSTKV